MSTTKPPILDLFGEPDINFLLQTRPTPKEKKAKTTTVRKEPATDRPQKPAAKKTTNPIPDKNIQQAFLPGLSRRGRPRSKDPISAVERTAKHRRERLDAGSKRVEVILSPDVAQGLEALATHFKEPKSEVVSTLIKKAFTKLLKTNAATRS